MAVLRAAEWLTGCGERLLAASSTATVLFVAEPVEE